MTIEAFLTMLDGVKQRGSRWGARCPAHADNSPSLSVSEGDKGILVRCFAGCDLRSICAALQIQPADLFFDALDSDPRKRRAAVRERDQRRQQQAAEAHKQGTIIDALREADYFVRSRQGLDISKWSHRRLNKELGTLADAYHLLDHEHLYE